MINFLESGHIYFDNKKNIYNSMTTVIGHYANKFEDTSDFWEEYKAIQYLTYGTKTFANKYNPEIHKAVALACKTFTGSFYLFDREDCQKILHNSHFTKRINSQYINKNFENLITQCKSIIKGFWDEKNAISKSVGTAFHLEREAIQEDFYKGEDYKLAKWEWLPELGKYNFEPGKMYNEVRIAHPQYRIAGMIDRIHCDKNGMLWVRDWKGLALDTPVPTKNGFKLIKNLTTKDLIFDGDGKLTKIKNISEIHNNPCYKIIFDTNDELIADHEHKWVISENKYQGKVVSKEMTTKDIFEYYLKNTKKLFIPCTKVEMDKVDLPLDPYILGLWLADGNRTCGTITCVNNNIWSEIHKRGFLTSINHNKNFKNKAESRTVYGIITQLKNLNLLSNKHIPDLYLRSSHAQRLDLLRGFMDGDGHFHRKRKRVIMDTTKKWQADAIITLASSLGYKTTLLKCKANGFGKTNIPRFQVCFSPPENPFLVRNTDYLNLRKNSSTFNSENRYIKSIIEIATVPTKCLEVESKTHCYLAGYSFIKTHNTNEEIKLKGFSGQKLKAPLDNLQDCELSKYTLQLNGYAFMLECLGYTVLGTQFEHFLKDGQGGFEKEPVIYECPYDKDMIISMFDDYTSFRDNRKLL